MSTAPTYVARMRAYVKEHVMAEEFVPGRDATEHVAKLRATDPDLLDGFLQEYAVTILREFIAGINRAERGHRARWANRTAFVDAAREHEAGNPAALERFRYLDQHFCVDKGNTQKRLGDLAHGELVFVAASFRARATQNQVKALVFEKIAKRVKANGGTVRDHYTEDQLARMFGSAGDAAA